MDRKSLYDVSQKYRGMTEDEKKRMVYREYNRTKEILCMISKLKIGQEKKYQLMGEHMYDKLKKILTGRKEYVFSFLNNRYDSTWKNVMDVRMGYNNYVYKKVPIIYLKIKRVTTKNERIVKFITLFLKQKEIIAKNELFDPNIFRIINGYL